ncbi:membrane transporter [Eremomyces bilateralis CBS 781.70]|uniref:Membrane transporter n=1 Tax=Eremomyces bilateralis CBS 781.70 TaxID=1392243 RepID=A0A6G1G9J1_9PEZI|nr:membrane transporter [Eremomyces bilateralis CBS 781.70]KAF1814571.1 membrane transporter [Eremomyces bilateralis CBS 781.70]
MDTKEEEKAVAGTIADPELTSLDSASLIKGDILGQESTDPVLNAKMKLVNDTIEEIGWTGYQTKLFFLNGFGYAVDSLILLIQSITASQAALEFRATFAEGQTIAVYVGMLVGALFWGLSADVIGRKFAFNCSLMISSVFAIAAGASPNWEVLGLFNCLSAFGSGGNLVLDTAVFLEYLPGQYQYLLTLLAAWWGVGQLTVGLLAWAFMPKWSCLDSDSCTWQNNKGWRLVWFVSGALVLVMSVLRVTVIRLKETPKFLLGEGKDDEVVEVLSSIAVKYNRPCSLTVERLQACGVTGQPDGRRASLSHARNKWSIGEITVHFRGLYATKRIGISTSLIWFSWLLIGLAYPLYNVFLPIYLKTRGAQFGETSEYIRWRNYALVNMAGIFGPIPAAYMAKSRYFWGRKGTMIIGAILTSIFFFAYTQVRSADQNVAFTVVVNFLLNIYYGTLYAFTPEVLPSAHRGTGNGIAIALNRFMGIMSAVIAHFADTATSVPIYICAALYIVMAIVAACFPFEPHGRRSS